jgi:hypothetical protein
MHLIGAYAEFIPTWRQVCIPRIVGAAGNGDRYSHYIAPLTTSCVCVVCVVAWWCVVWVGGIVGVIFNSSLMRKLSTTEALRGRSTLDLLAEDANQAHSSHVSRDFYQLVFLLFSRLALFSQSRLPHTHVLTLHTYSHARPDVSRREANTAVVCSKSSNPTSHG